MTSSLRLALLVSLTAAAACEEPGPAPPPVGDERTGQLGGPCSVEGQCNTGLICSVDTCVQDPLAGEGEGEGENPGEGEGEGENPGEGEGEGEGEPACPGGDRDGDGVCDDVDCAPDDGAVNQDTPERCDDVDNNCDGDNNEGIDCSFIAHDRDTLYRVDPWAESATLRTEVNLLGDAGLLDVDIDVDGTVLAVTSEGIYEISTSGQMIEVADIPTPTGTNGMAINDDGELFLTTRDGADSAAWKVDRTVSPPSLLLVGEFSGGQQSSGDCVFTKTGDLLMSATVSGSGNDTLVEVNVVTGATTSIGNLGRPAVYGLSATANEVFGVNNRSEVFTVDARSGATSLVFTVAPFVSFNGAANGD